MVGVSTLIRRARSTIHARAHADGSAAVTAEDQNNFVNNSQVTDNGLPPPVPPKDSSNPSFFHRLSSFRDHRRSHIDLSTAVESDLSIQAREKQLEKQSSITHLRRRLVRKASTFNLHSRRLAQDASHRRSEHLFPDTDTDSDSPAKVKHRRHLSASEPATPDTTFTAYSQVAQAAIGYKDFSKITDHDSISSKTTVISPAQVVPENQPQSNTQADARLRTQHLASRKGGFDTKVKDSFKMANVNAPLPYETLKKITVDACDAALSDVKAYDHPKTEAWNTRIINTILAQLVGETSGNADGVDGADGADESDAPRYKFVVNSTIVQHRNSYSDSPNSRRGMHSAAGAYWNNEKDGMWSFKYDAGDSKGLDVVVGIVWVWVG